MATLQACGKKLLVDGKPVLKGWESYSGWYWFATELDVDGPGVHFGLVQGFEEEWGYFSEAELNSLGRYKVWPIPKRNLPWSGRREATP